MFLYFLLKIEFLNIKMYKKKYIDILLKKFPDIASGRKNFKYYDKRILKNLLLTKKYMKKKTEK